VVLVNAVPDKFVYQLNHGLWQEVPRHILAIGTNPTKTAMTLL
jgi:hypothetical protein